MLISIVFKDILGVKSFLQKHSRHIEEHKKSHSDYFGLKFEFHTCALIWHIVNCVSLKKKLLYVKHMQKSTSHLQFLVFRLVAKSLTLHMIPKIFGICRTVTPQ